MNVKELFGNIRKIISDSLPSAKLYLIGESLRDILKEKKPSFFEFFIETKDIEKADSIIPRLSVFKNTKFITGKKINTDKEILTINCLYLDVDDILNNNSNNIQSFSNGLRDFNKGVVKLTERAKTSFEESPSMVFSILNTLDETDFYIDPNTAYFIFTKRSSFFKIEKRRIFNFLKETVKRNHPRKFISHLNTFGISKELFDTNLIETPVVNHLKSNDVYELFAVLFDNIEINDLESFLVEKCGILLKDVEHITRISKILRNIEDESEAQALKILASVERQRIINFCRLLKAMNFKTLAKHIRKNKTQYYAKNILCIDERAIKTAFGISDPKIVSMLLEIAKLKIATNPEFNEKSKIILYLNSERTRLCQDQDQMS